MVRITLLSMFLLLASLEVRAQGDLESERSSLEGVPSFQVTVTIEGPEHLAESETLAAETVRRRVTSRLREAGLPPVPRSDDVPALHVHVNMMEVGSGLVPFSIDLAFYQDVELARSGRAMRAATWDESVLGLVSMDMIATIPEAVDGLVDQFIDDFGGR